MPSIGFVDLAFLGLVALFTGIMVWKILHPPKPRDYPYQIQLDEEFEKYIRSLREDGSSRK